MTTGEAPHKGSGLAVVLTLGFTGAGSSGQGEHGEFVEAVVDQFGDVDAEGVGDGHQGGELARRATVLGPLADRRGARGRARAVRDAARAGEDLAAVELDGAQTTHRAQVPLFDEPTRVYTDAEHVPGVMVVESGEPTRAGVLNQPGLFAEWELDES